MLAECLESMTVQCRYHIQIFYWHIPSWSTALSQSGVMQSASMFERHSAGPSRNLASIVGGLQMLTCLQAQVQGCKLGSCGPAPATTVHGSIKVIEPLASKAHLHPRKQSFYQGNCADEKVSKYEKQSFSISYHIIS